MKRVHIQSAGMVPVYEDPNGPQVLLVEQQHGPDSTRWCFPKGKQEPGEELIETAAREVWEEAGLDITEAVEHNPFTVNFEVTFKNAITDKTVNYFLGYADNQAVEFCQTEVLGGGWFSFADARNKLTFDVDKQLFDQVITFYTEHKHSQQAL